ncbi:MAG: hypothetical protein JWO77_3336 [Ilumatobacteraceae bacterium]|nr:hypothetical protein [Ilumatobacteraceae bacterium]
MKQIPRRRALAVVLTVLLAASTAAATTACDPISRTWAWKGGKTHGAVIEPTAGRASVAIYRRATDGLFLVYKAKGMRFTQDVMWSLGKPPELKKTFTYKGRSLTLSFGAGTKYLRNKAHAAIYDQSSDLRGALLDAHARRSCLALTLLSFGRPTSNWTQKQIDCRDGAMP